MALTTQQSTHCNDCQGNHLPGEHHAPRSRPRGGGRHLAPKKSGLPVGPRRDARPQRQAVARPKVMADAKGRSLPTAEELGTSTSELIRKVARWGRHLVQGTVGSCRQWLVETRRGFRDLIDLDSLTLEADESRHIEKPERPRRPVRSKHVARPVRESGRIDGSTARNQARTRSAQVELVEQGAASREHLLEVSVLESLGFFDPANEIVVTMATDATSYPPGISVAAPHEPGRPPGTGARQLIPDIDLTSWKPHVIARSKLGKGRFSAATITAVLISLLVLAVIATNLLRTPANETARQEDALTMASTQLAAALGGLETVLANVTTDVAEATSTLISVDTAARDLFDTAALLGEGTEQQVLRQSAVNVAQRSLALESSVGDALNYRLVLNPLWNSPDLAGVVDPTQAAAAVAPWQARLNDMVQSLPTSTGLGVHVDQVRGFVEGLEAWRVRYLDALALDDLATAEGAVADLNGQLALLAQSGEDILSGLFDDANTERGRILSDLAAISG